MSLPYPYQIEHRPNGTGNMVAFKVYPPPMGLDPAGKPVPLASRVEFASDEELACWHAYQEAKGELGAMQAAHATAAGELEGLKAVIAEAKAKAGKGK